MENFMARQGDVLIVGGAKIPATAIKQNNCILAYGEVTGHKHEISTEQAFMWVDTDGTKYVEVYGNEAVLQHPEHGPILLSGPAIYRVIQQREYFPQEIRNVAD